MMNASKDISCQYAGADFYENSWKNYSQFWNNTWQFQDYICQYMGYFGFQEKSISFENYAYLILSLIGLISAILSLIIFSRKEFQNALGFLMYKAIAWLDLCFMTVLILYRISNFLKESKNSYGYMLFSIHFLRILVNACPDALDLLILFLCIERITACFFPLHFKKLHSKWIYITVIIFAILVALLINLPFGFEMKVVYIPVPKGHYTQELSVFGKSQFFEVYYDVNSGRFFVIGALITVATCISIAGLLKVRKNKLRLLERCGSSQSQTNTGQRHNILEMCALQLYLAIPAVITSCLVSIREIVSKGMVWSFGEQVFVGKLTYSQAIQELDSIRRERIFNLVIGMLCILPCALRFYLYLLFCPIVRRSFLAVIKEMKKSSPETDGYRSVSLIRRSATEESAV